MQVTAGAAPASASAPHLFPSNKRPQIYMRVLPRSKVRLLMRCIEQVALVQQAVQFLRVGLEQQRGVGRVPVRAKPLLHPNRKY